MPVSRPRAALGGFAPSGYTVCGVCGRLTPSDSKFCTHCGAPLGGGGGGGGSAYKWDIRLGVAPDGGVLGISRDDLASHMLILGNVGTGKTTAAKRLVFEAFKSGVGFIVFDWEGEYSSLTNLFRATVLGGPKSRTPLRLGLFEGGRWGIGFSHTVSEVLLRFIRETGGDVTPQMERALRRAVHESVSRGGGLEGFRRAIERAAGRWAQTADALEARLYSLLEGELAPLLGGPRTLRVDPGEGVVVDLSWLSRASRSLARQALQLTLAALQALLPSRFSGRLRFLVVIDEAEEAAPAYTRRPHGPGSELVSDLMHHRKRGVGVVLVAHSLGLLDQGVARLASNLLVFRLDDHEDARGAASRLGVAPELVQSLGRGEALLKPAGLSRAELVKVEPVPTLSPDALMLLDHIRLYPGLAQRERRSHLRMTGSEYAVAARELERLGLIVRVQVQTGWGRPAVLLDIPGSRPGAAHRFLERRLRVRLERGLGVRVESPGDADMSFVVGGVRVAVEVETGSNVDAGKYMRLLDSYNALLVVCSNKKCIRTAEKALADAGWPKHRAGVALLASALSEARRLVQLSGPAASVNPATGQACMRVEMCT